MKIEDIMWYGFITLSVLTLVHMNWQVIDLNHDIQSVKVHIGITENIQGAYFDDLYCVSTEGITWGLEDHERCHAMIEDDKEHFCR